MTPTLIRSLAPITRLLALLEDLAAIALPIERLVAPTVFRKSLRESLLDMNAPYHLLKRHFGSFATGVSAAARRPPPNPPPTPPPRLSGRQFGRGRIYPIRPRAAETKAAGHRLGHAGQEQRQGHTPRL